MKGVLRNLRLRRYKVRPMFMGFIFAAFVLLVCLWRLGTSTDGLGPQEYLSRQNSLSLQHILDNGINAPYHLLTHLFLSLGHDGIFYLRLVSVIFGALIVFCLYRLLCLGFGKSTALFTSFLFVTTPWLLLSARSAQPLILLQWSVLVVGAFVWMIRSKSKPGIAWLALCTVTALGLYIPGHIWLLLIGALLGRKSLKAAFARLSRVYITAGVVVMALILSPLVMALVSSTYLIRQMLLIPAAFAPLPELLRSIAWSFFGIFWRTQTHIDIGVGRLPLLNILGISMCVFGAYALFRHSRRLTYFLASIIIFSVLATGINQNPQMLLFGLPAIVVYIAAGVRYLFIEWKRVFPYNPFARGLAIALICLVLVMQVLYGLRYALVAWPNTEATKSTYVLK